MKCDLRSGQGFTLVETAVSASIFALVAAGVVATTMMTSRLAHENIYENTAYMVAQGYAEQIKSIQFKAIRDALENPAEKNIPTQSLSFGTGASGEELKEDDPLIFGVELEKEVVVDLETEANGEVRERIMKMWIRPSGTDLGATGASCWDSIEVVLDFDWQVSDGNANRQRSGSVRLVKTNVSEF